MRETAPGGFRIFWHYQRSYAVKVALVSHFWYPIAEPFVGGTEAFIFRCAAALARAGIEVVCYACEGSQIPGVEIRTLGVAQGELATLQTQEGRSSYRMIALRDREDAVMWAALDDACRDPSIDLIHNNSFSAIPLFFSTLLPKPILHTLHLPPVVPTMAKAIRFCYEHGRELQLVAGSQAHARTWQEHHPVRQVIYYRFDTDALPPSTTTHEGTLAFAGRIDPTKGVEDAIAVATLLGKRLDIYGPTHPPLATYFETHIQPLLRAHPSITYHGLVSQATLLEGLSKAQALLFPIKWDEPFGYVTIEAMAMGTPVIMYDRGAAHELIREGLNGFIVEPNNVQAMADTVARTELVDRASCARYTREQYHIARSAREYIHLFEALLQAFPRNQNTPGFQA
jgi:glycosyltransferase involved in cell wall biosynthesis